jgi:hypothetical protein
MAPVFLLLLPILVSILGTLPHWPTVEAVEQSEQLGQSLSSTIINNSGAEEEAIYHPPLSVNGGGEAMDKVCVKELFYNYTVL